MDYNVISKDLEEKLMQAQSDSEFAQILTDAGIPVTVEQLHAIEDNTEGELNEETLDSVAGGAIWYIIKKLLQRYHHGGGGSCGGGGSSRRF